MPDDGGPRQLIARLLNQFCNDDRDGPFEDGEHPLIDEARALLQGPPLPLTGGNARQHLICLCPDCTAPAAQPVPAARPVKGCVFCKHPDSRASCSALQLTGNLEHC